MVEHFIYCIADSNGSWNMMIIYDTKWVLSWHIRFLFHNTPQISEKEEMTFYLLYLSRDDEDDDVFS